MSLVAFYWKGNRLGWQQFGMFAFVLSQFSPRVIIAMWMGKASIEFMKEVSFLSVELHKLPQTNVKQTGTTFCFVECRCVSGWEVVDVKYDRIVSENCTNRETYILYVD